MFALLLRKSRDGVREIFVSQLSAFFAPSELISTRVKLSFNFLLGSQVSPPQRPAAQRG